MILFFSFEMAGMAPNFILQSGAAAVTQTEVSLCDSSLSHSLIPVNLSTEAAEALLLTNGD